MTDVDTIRARLADHDPVARLRNGGAWWMVDVAVLLAEVDRLRGAIAKHRDEHAQLLTFDRANGGLRPVPPDGCDERLWAALDR